AGPVGERAHQELVAGCGISRAAGYPSSDQLRRIPRLGSRIGGDDRDGVRISAVSHGRPRRAGSVAKSLMASNLANLMFRAMYRFGFKPWDSGVPPPELKELIEGPEARPPGRALDLGCGTGTMFFRLAQLAGASTGLNFSPPWAREGVQRVQPPTFSP